MASTIQQTPKKKSATTSPRAGRTTKPEVPLTTREDVAVRAHELYVRSGYQGGREVEFWLEAERQLREDITT